MAENLRLRKDITELSDPELDMLIRAFKHITELPPDDRNSFFTIASYHGLPMPFYCSHGNVLFPTWHRAYLLRLENALRSVEGCEILAMPFWNETEEETRRNGLPGIFTEKEYTFRDGSGTIANPLYSYQMQKAIADPDPEAFPHKYDRDTTYKTVRYPFSGLHHKHPSTIGYNHLLNMLGVGEVTKILNKNITTWLTQKTYRVHDGKEVPADEVVQFEECLKAPNYTVFSNTASAKQWNDDRKDTKIEPVIVPLEKPHNVLHLAIGGFEVPGLGNYNSYPGANGDMGENDTAAFDPVFYFHHCFIDYMFWMWQCLQGRTDKLDIIADDDYPGTTRGKGANKEKLTLATGLEPFKKEDLSLGGNELVASQDVINIERQLGYSYAVPQKFIGELPPVEAPKLLVSDIRRADITGSSLVTVWEKRGSGQPDTLAHVDAILSPWHFDACDNCQEHPVAETYMHLTGISGDVKEDRFRAKLHTRANREGEDISHLIRVYP